MKYPTPQLAQMIADELNQQYANKFIYAVPDWAILYAEPELLFILPIYGEEGIAITKQVVNFPVDFSSRSSVLYYAHFLESQMNKELEIKAYVVFYNKNILVGKDPNYLDLLTKEQEDEIRSYNDKRIKVEISACYFNSVFSPLSSLTE